MNRLKIFSVSVIDSIFITHYSLTATRPLKYSLHLVFVLTINILIISKDYHLAILRVFYA